MRLSLTTVLLVLGLWLGGAVQQLVDGGCTVCRDEACSGQSGSGHDHRDADHCPTPNACSCCGAQIAAAPRAVALATTTPESATCVPESPPTLAGREPAAPPQRPPIV